MFYIEPNTTIDFFRDVPFDPGYENTMRFDTLADQNNYFNTKLFVSVPANSYQRISKGSMKIAWNTIVNDYPVIRELYCADYMRFKNTNYENKWFYAFIDKVDYINNNTVQVDYHIDVVQTWLFDFRFNQCMIEREHTVTDEIGDNLIPENFELGDYVMDATNEFNYEPTAVVVSVGDISGDYDPGVVLQGLEDKGNWFSGVHFYPFVLSNQAAVDDLNDFLEAAYTDRESLNTIIAVFVMPNTFLGIPRNVQTVNETVFSQSGAGAYTIGRYPIRNRKLMTYPYNMLYVTNYQGQHLELHFEYFNDPANCQMKIWGNVSTNPGMVLYPVNYKTTGNNFDEMLQITGFPMCAWGNDAYRAWVAQNAGTINLAIAGAAYSWGETISKAYSTGLVGEKGEHTIAAVRPNEAKREVGTSLRNSLAATGAIIARMRDHAVQPPTAHGSGNGNLQYQMGKLTFMWCHKHIREEFAQIIDNFFDMYGYASHRIGYPSLDNRPCYTYVKTSNASMYGNIPVEDLRILEQIFDNGIRFWNTSAVFGVFDFRVNDNSPYNQ